MLFLNWLLRPRTAQALGRHRFRKNSPSLAECLEDRTLLTAYLVDTLDDTISADGKLSLREAIQAANTNEAVNEAAAGEGDGVTDTIAFDTSLAGGTLTLGGERLEISESISISGLGASQLEISGGNSSQIFYVSAEGTLTLRDLTLTGGRAEDSDLMSRRGGAVLSLGALTLERVNVVANSAAGDGGGIFSGASLVIVGGMFTDNSASRGGAITAAQQFLVTNATFARNSSSVSGGALWLGRQATIQTAVFEDNYSVFGGAVYCVGPENPDVVVQIDDSVFQRNAAYSSGGAIYDSGSAVVSITASQFTENSSDYGGAIGGGGPLTVSASNLSANSARFGGAISFDGLLKVVGSTIAGNLASDSGGGIHVNVGRLIVERSTLTNNSAVMSGGAVSFDGSSADVINTTLSGNSSGADGGGVSVLRGVATLRNATIFGNRADSDGDGSGYGGGVFANSSGQITAYNTIIAGNVRKTDSESADDVAGYLQAASKNNLVGDVQSAGGLTDGVRGNIVGVDWTAVLDPVLRLNGGPTATHALFAGSVAVNSGNRQEAIDSVGNALLFDQRGEGFARSVGQVDIGAFELQTLASPVVTTLDDEDDGDYSLDDLSLREAVKIAASGTTVTFAAFLSGGTVKLSLGEIVFRSDVTVRGLGADRLAVSGGGLSRVFRVETGVTVAMSGLTVTGGKADTGGGILNDRGTVILTDVAVIGNIASGYGGGVFNLNGEVTLINSMVADNAAGESGGGISSFGTLQISGGTVSDNSARLDGGGVYNYGTLEMSGADILQNVAGYGGGIYSESGSVTISNISILKNSSNFFRGGGVYNRDLLSVARCEFSDNFGGGIYSNPTYSPDLKILVVTDSLFTNNRATTGGAIRAFESVSIGGTSFARNEALSGGAVMSFSLVIAVGSTFSANVATSGDGGAISGRTVVLVNSTVSGNSAAGSGGGVIAGGGSQFRNVTVFGNRADADGDGSGAGGGFMVTGGAFSIWNTIVAGNSRGGESTAGDDIGGSLTAASSHNLISDAATAGGLTQGDDGNVVGIDWRTVLDPVLRDNGGPTWTHALLAGSAAVDGGSDADAVDPQGQPLITDQRGSGFPRILRGRVDMGAFELTNSGPTAADDFLRVREDLTADGNLLPNDSDPDRDGLTVVAVNGMAMAVGSAVALPSRALITVNSDGTFVYDPNDAFEWLVPGETAVDFFTYSISDGQGGVATATVRIVVFGAGTADLVGYFDGQWYVGVSDATSFDSSTWADWSAIAPSAMRQGDFNGDGSVDVLGFVNGAWWVGLSDGNSFVTKQWGAWSNLDWQDVSVGDLDSDGKDDILARYHGSWWIALSNGTGFETPERWTMWSDKPWQHVSLVDLDADGDSDLLADLNGAWWASLSTGSGFETARRWGAWDNLAWDAIGTFDANGDRRADVYAFSRGTWYVGISDGSAFTIGVRAAWKDAAWADAIVGDFNGDGRDDVAARLAGAWWVGLSTLAGGAGETSHWAAWKDLDWQNVTVGDFDGDGLDDIAARNRSGWWVARSNGTGFETSMWGTWQNVDWTAVIAAETSLPPDSSPVTLMSAQVANEHAALAMLWSAGDDDDFAAALLAV